MTVMVGGAHAEIAAIYLQGQALKIIEFSIDTGCVNRDVVVKVTPIGFCCNAPILDMELVGGAQAAEIGSHVRRVDLLRRDNPGVGKSHIDDVTVDKKRCAQLSSFELPAL